jgi:hypothetical protein
MQSTPTYDELLNLELNWEEKLSLVNKELKQLMIHFNKKADQGKRNFQGYKYGSILLAAMTTVISSLQVIYIHQFPEWILPVVSAGATVMVAFLGASSAQKIWIHSKTTQQRLHTEQFLYNQEAGKYQQLSKEQRLSLFSENMVKLWNEGHVKWEETIGEV